MQIFAFAVIGPQSPFDICLELAAFIRPERQFENAESLKLQITEDISQIMNILERS